MRIYLALRLEYEPEIEWANQKKSVDLPKGVAGFLFGFYSREDLYAYYGEGTDYVVVEVTDRQAAEKLRDRRKQNVESTDKRPVS
jgi:hypothetical protein